MMGIFRALMTAAGGGNYTKLQYLESTNGYNQYINTGYVPDNTTPMYLRLQSTFNYGEWASIGVIDTSRFGFSYKKESCIAQFGTKYRVLDNVQVAVGDVAECSINNGNYAINNLTTGQTFAAQYANVFTCNLSFWLFAPNFINRFYAMRIFAAKVGNLDLIPVLWKANKPYIDGNTGATVTPTADKPGMYDKVSGRLFVNQRSGADFLYA